MEINPLGRPHVGKRLFITGIPTSGKSHLANAISKEVGGIAIPLDDVREGLSKDPAYRKWVNFYLDLDEEKYLRETTPEDQWRNLVAQSEALWPVFVQEIGKYKDKKCPVIFECVNLLPHLVKKDFNWPMIVLVGSSYEETLERNKKDPRWGETAQLQELEAKAFFEVERPNYAQEAQKFGYPVFEHTDKALEYAKSILNKNLF